MMQVLVLLSAQGGGAFPLTGNCESPSSWMPSNLAQLCPDFGPTSSNAFRSPALHDSLSNSRSRQKNVLAKGVVLGCS